MPFYPSVTASFTSIATGTIINSHVTELHDEIESIEEELYY